MRSETSALGVKKLITICILSFIAFVNASYLTYNNYKIEQNIGKIGSFCDINNTLSCSNVLSSPYSKIFGLPFTAYAMIVYPIIFVIAFLGITSVLKKSEKIIAILGLGGILFNSYFIYQEFANIGSYCPLCMLCSAIIITIFILALIGIKNENK
ncbi:vitamin K epoxide reductase family protein [Candidatus Gracilibacteria bacterium]|nr:vitamin K epoxide reductase family protein [Candidatus Gracilibacteria bacterium]